MSLVPKRCASFLAVIIFAAVSFAASDPTTIDEFNATQVTNPQMEARCQNFADAGMQYVFKIINGKVFYSRNGVFLYEFMHSDDGMAAYVNLTASRNNSGKSVAQQISAAPAFDMITARNNRVLVKESNSTRLYWASLIPEYKNEPPFRYYNV